MVKQPLLFPLLGLSAPPPPPNNAVTLGHVSVRQFEVSMSHNVKLPSRKGKPVLTMHLIFHLISTNTLRDVKGEVWAVSCWQTQTHQCKSHPRQGPGWGCFPSWRLLFLAGWLTKQGPFPSMCLVLGESGAASNKADLPSSLEVSCAPLHLRSLALREWRDRATPSFARGIEAAFYQLSTITDSPCALFTKWKQMNSIKHKPPELWLPLYLVVKEFIHNWHMIFSSGFKLFPNVKRNLSVWEWDGFVSNQSIMPSKGRERVGRRSETRKAASGSWPPALIGADGGRRRVSEKSCTKPPFGTCAGSREWDSVTLGMESHRVPHIYQCSLLLDHEIQK